MEEVKKRINEDEFALYSGNDDNVVEFYINVEVRCYLSYCKCYPQEFQDLYDAKQSGENISSQFEPIGQLLDSLSVDVNLFLLRH